MGSNHRDIGKCLNLGLSAVTEVLTRFKYSDLSWPLPDGFSAKQLEVMLYTTKAVKRNKSLPNVVQMREELNRKDISKLLLWQEYCQGETATAYGYTQCCEHYQLWLKKQKRSMRQQHIPADKLFIDY